MATIIIIIIKKKIIIVVVSLGWLTSLLHLEGWNNIWKVPSRNMFHLEGLGLE